MLNKKKVAGTVILHLKDGTKRFLLHNAGTEIKFLTVELSNERTGLACALQLLKEEACLDVTTIQLVELTNGFEDNEKIPLFVFEMTEKEEVPVLPTNICWEDAEQFRELIQAFKIEGMPFF
ncbi:hypothetical protein ACYSNO_03645 [Enterococcus sp. LJL98]